MSSLIDAHFHSEGDIPKGYSGCGIGLPISNNDLYFGGHGIHPWSITPKTKFQPPETTCIIGEIGLDYQKPFNHTIKSQNSYLESALKHAAHFNCPVVLHCVRAHNDLFSVMKNYPTIRYYLHGFIGRNELASQFLKGFPNVWFGWSPRALHSEKTKSCFQNLSLKRILIETDTQPNIELLTSLYIAIAKLHNTKLTDVIEQVKVNFRSWLGPIGHQTNP